MIHFRPASNNDLAHLYDIDLKCHEQSPADSEWWRQIAENPQAGGVVALKRQVPIGMLIYERQAFRLPKFKAKVTTLHIHKLCVHPLHQNQYVGQKLLAHGHEEARKKGCPYMTISVPEYQCQPSAEDDVSKWLNKLGFKAVMILPTKVYLYGQEFDQYLFVFQVKV